MATKYWAANETELCIREAWTKIGNFYAVMRSSRLLDLYRNAYWNRYTGARSGGNVGIAGEIGELTSIDVNNYGNIIQHQLTLVMSQRPAFDAKANNADHKSMAQAIMANALIETVMREKGLESVERTVVDYGLTYGEGAMMVTWDQFAGPVYRAKGAEEGDRGSNVGDVKFWPLSPLDVVRDTTRESTHNQSYVMIRTFENKYDLMARHPEIADEIDGVKNVQNAEGEHPRIWSYQYSQIPGVYDSEEVPVWTMFHRHSDAVPEGRMTTFLGPDIILSDGPLPYRRIPVFFFKPLDMHGTPWGYANSFDILALQYAYNSVMSTIVTNQAALGVQNVWVPAGSNLSWKEIVGGLNLVEGGTQPPQPLNLLNNKEETFKLLDILEKQQETTSGVNAVQRGDPAASLKSGAALAMVQAQSVQFNFPTQMSYIKHLEQVGTEVLHQYQDFASLPHVITLTGQDNRQYTHEFVGKDIDNIDRVTIQIGNPLSSTIAGRYNIAELMAQMQLVKSPEQLDMVLTTGRLEPVTKGPQREMMNITSENERLMNGKAVTAALFDNHPLHIQENSTVLDSPESREDPAVVQAVTAHLMEHMNLWQQAAMQAPAILAAKKIPPPPMPMPPPMPAGFNPPGGPQPGQMPMPPNPGQPPMPPRGGQQPNMPKNPMTNQRAPLPSNATPPMDLE